MAKSIKVVPAVLTDDPKVLETLLQQSETFTDYVQIDIMDGKFVPSRSVTWEQVSAVKTKIGWEVHLMVEHPETQLERYKKAGTQKAIFHFESTPNPEKVIAAARKINLKVGLAANPETPIAKIKPLVGQVDGVLFLSVHPGFYGAKFIPEVLDKIVELRQARPELEIGIDGGIKESNIVQIAKTGVNVIFVGSAVYLQPQPGESFRKLQALANQPV
jgi:ribulose-phosphate 3-epimerase